MPRAPSRLGLLATGLAALCAAGLGTLTASNQTPGLPAEVPWPIVFGAILAMPALIGGLGAVSGSRTLLVAAGVLCLVQSILSFSGVTLVFLVPALLFLRAGAVAPRPETQLGEPVRALRWLALVALAVPVAVLVVLNLGIFGTVGLVAFGALAPALRRRTTRVRSRDLLVGIATVGLVLAAMVAAFGNTQTICWNVRSTSAGLVYERIPVQQDSGPIGGDTGIVSSGCAGGQPTIEGAALTAVFLVGALAIAVQATRP